MEPRPPPPPDMIYPLDGVSRLFIPGNVREEAAEVLFEQVRNPTATLCPIFIYLVCTADWILPAWCRFDPSKSPIITLFLISAADVQAESAIALKFIATVV